MWCCEDCDPLRTQGREACWTKSEIINPNPSPPEPCCCCNNAIAISLLCDVTEIADWEVEETTEWRDEPLKLNLCRDDREDPANGDGGARGAIGATGAFGAIGGPDGVWDARREGGRGRAGLVRWVW